MFRKKKEKPTFPYDPARHTAVMRCSICTGEQVAGFRDRETGRFHEVVWIRSDGDLTRFLESYGLTEIAKEY